MQEEEMSGESIEMMRYGDLIGTEEIGIECLALPFKSAVLKTVLFGASIANKTSFNGLDLNGNKNPVLWFGLVLDPTNMFGVVTTEMKSIIGNTTIGTNPTEPAAKSLLVMMVLSGV